mgnify:CR=1 FL=1
MPLPAGGAVEGWDPLALRPQGGPLLCSSAQRVAGLQRASGMGIPSDTRGNGETPQYETGPLRRGEGGVRGGGDVVSVTQPPYSLYVTSL